MRRLLIPQVLAPVGPEGVPIGPVETLTGRIMGTTWSVRFVPTRPGDAARIRDGIQVEFARLLAQVSHWDRDSALVRFNRAPAGTRQVLPDALFTVVSAACSLAETSGGAYDPTLGALVDLWGFGPPGPVEAIPDASAVAAARARTGWRRLDLDRVNRTALQPGGLQLDLSAIAKGHAVDAVSELLSRDGIRHHLVEIGGELRGSGVKPDRQPWWVGIDRAGHAPDTVVALHDLAVASSGDYRRSLVLDGDRFGHTIDPATGRPVGGAAWSVSVLHRSCMIADSVATAILVLGPERGLAYADKHDVICCIQDAEGTRFSQAAESMTAAPDSG